MEIICPRCGVRERRSPVFKRYHNIKTDRTSCACPYCLHKFDEPHTATPPAPAVTGESFAHD